MNLLFSKILPGGNSTIIVESPVECALRPGVANILMKPNYLNAEQVGFLVPARSNNADARLEMMGGELCINALRSTSALLFSRDAGKNILRLESSGFQGMLLCENNKMNDVVTTTITLECPLVYEPMEGGDLVKLDGIAHLVCREEVLPESAVLMSAFREIVGRNQVIASYAAAGYMPYVETADGVSFCPLVYVRDTNSFILETGCGSGSIAIALLRYAKQGKKRTRVMQPSGEPYTVTVEPKNDQNVRITLESSVRVIASGVVSLSPSLP